MDKKAISQALLSRAASAAATKARFAGKAKQIAGTRNAMSALRGNPSLTLRRGEGMLAAVENKALRQEARFKNALTPFQKAAGTGTYGPGGKWIHDRAHAIMDDGKTPKSVAYAVATQQAHATKKSPKSFRTAEGVREAKSKYDSPKTMQKAAYVTAFFGELEKIGGLLERVFIGAVERPSVVMGRVLSADDRSKRPNLVNALQEGYPASWVSLGMRPHPRE